MAPIKTTAPRIAKGMEEPTIREAFISPKKRKIISIEITTAIIMVWNTLDRELLMLSAESEITWISRLGFFPSNFLIKVFTSLLMAMSDLLCSLFKLKVMVSSPLYRPILLLSERAEPTVAKSERVKVFPVPVVIGSFRNSSMVE